MFYLITVSVIIIKKSIYKACCSTQNQPKQQTYLKTPLKRTLSNMERRERYDYKYSTQF